MTKLNEITQAPKRDTTVPNEAYNALIGILAAHGETDLAIAEVQAVLVEASKTAAVLDADVQLAITRRITSQSLSELAAEETKANQEIAAAEARIKAAIADRDAIVFRWQPVLFEAGSAQSTGRAPRREAAIRAGRPVSYSLTERDRAVIATTLARGQLHKAEQSIDDCRSPAETREVQERILAAKQRLATAETALAAN